MKRAVTLVALTACFCLFLGPHLLAGPTHPVFGKFVNAGGVPAGSRLVLNVTYKVVNDEDSGNVGYWALSHYNKQLQVWQAPDAETFYVVGRYTGTWQTFAGALSPGSGAEQTGDASGNFAGGYFATFKFSGIFNPGAYKTYGNIGAYDFEGTKVDVLLGTYGAGQLGPAAPVSVLGLYFPGYGAFNYINWGWTYRYRGQVWANYDAANTGTTGDIIF